jgi:hypothetical protein
MDMELHTYHVYYILPATEIGVIQKAIQHPVYLANMFLIKLSLSIFCLFPGCAGDRIQKRARGGRKTSFTSSSSRARTSTTRTRAGT